jgi:hypothetical protein
MLERKRKAKTYTLASGEDDEYDLELGEGGNREEGIIRQHTLEEEVDNWDENAQDWDDDEPPTTEAVGEGSKTPPSSVEDGIETKTRDE